MIDREKFRQARNKLGLSQTDLAREGGVSQSLIADIEVGNVLSTKAIYKIAAALHVNASYLDPNIPGIDDDLMDMMVQIKTLHPEQEKRVRRQIKAAIRIEKGEPDE